MLHTHTIVVLDTAWPWASEAYGLCLPFARILLRAQTFTRKVIRPYRPADRCVKHARKSIVALDTAWPWANDTYGLCCLHAYFCARKHTCARSYVVIPQIGIAMGFLLQITMNWLRFRKSVGAGAGLGCWQLAERVFKTGKCHKLAAQAACILAPASRMSTGRGILPSYLGLCWCNSKNNELPARVFETGCWRWAPVLVLVR